ncbi:MAG: hypothetical protein JO166_21475 [Deltaproteobacteria bacterium]|nr:hypothetical protein [Deltaproteobacteria bacterium]
MAPTHDVGLSHIALLTTKPEASIAFYKKYAAMQVVHRRVDADPARTVVWLSDGSLMIRGAQAGEAGAG